METLATVKKEQNISIVQNAFADFANGNIAGILNACSDDIVWSSYNNPVVPYGQAYYGKKGTAAFFVSLAATVDYTVFDIKELFADGDRVFATGHNTATVKSTGNTYDHDFLMEFRLRDGLVSHFFAYVDSRDQAEAFGKSTAGMNKLTVQRFNKEFIEGGNINAFNEIISPDFINQTAPPGVSKGPEGVLYFFNHFLKPAFPDLKVEIQQQVAENDMVTTHKIFHATHKGEFMGIPATGKNITMEVMDIIRLKDGKFVEHWGILDMQSVMMQITAQ